VSQSKPVGKMRYLAVAWLPHVLVLGLVGIAILKMPHDYYVVMRWVATGAFIYLAMCELRDRRMGWLIALSVLAGMYNPFAPLGLRREAWLIVNVITCAVVAAHAWSMSHRATDKPMT